MLETEVAGVLLQEAGVHDVVDVAAGLLGEPAALVLVQAERRTAERVGAVEPAPGDLQAAVVELRREEHVGLVVAGVQVLNVLDVLEAALAELGDGRVVVLVRGPAGGQAESEDAGGADDGQGLANTHRCFSLNCSWEMLVDTYGDVRIIGKGT